MLKRTPSSPDGSLSHHAQHLAAPSFTFSAESASASSISAAERGGGRPDDDPPLRSSADEAMAIGCLFTEKEKLIIIN